MAERLGPLLPFKIVLTLMVALAAYAFWVTRSDAAVHLSRRPEGGLDVLPMRRSAGLAVVLIGNSRLGFAMQEPALVQQVVESMGQPDAERALIFGPEMVATDLTENASRLVGWRPTTIVVQFDVLFPLGAKSRQPAVVDRLLAFQRHGPDLTAGLTLLSQLWEARRVVLDIPLSERIYASMDEAWRHDRQAAYGLLRARGVEVLHDEPWSDDYYVDGVHFGPSGAIRFRRWLGETLAVR